MFAHDSKAALTSSVLLCAGQQGGEGDAEEAEGQGVHLREVQHQDAEECQALELMRSN